MARQRTPYQAVLVGGWDQLDRCLIAAERAGGHLATISSEAENTFVFGLAKDTRFVVFGPEAAELALARRLPTRGSAEPNGGWKWSRGSR